MSHATTTITPTATATPITTCAGASNRAFALGIALNVGFVVIELVYGWLSGSLALLADAGHNLSDVAGLVLAWGAALAGGLRPTHRRTYGWMRASILAALANALLLIFAMGVLAVEAVQRLQAPEPVAGWTVIVVAAIGVLVNGLTAMLFMAAASPTSTSAAPSCTWRATRWCRWGWSSRACSTCSSAGAGSTRW
jgi:cation diffusion facilitator family transporter